jgi:uncharacterized membrane protein YkoI
MRPSSVGALAVALGLCLMLPVDTQAAMQPLPLSRVVATAEQAIVGRVTDAELEVGRDGQLLYEIEVVRGRQLFEIQIDAISGRVLNRRQPLIEGYWERFAERTERGVLATARPVSDILRALEERTGGRALSVSLEIHADRVFYEVELSTELGVTDIYLDPASGNRVPVVPDD